MKTGRPRKASADRYPCGKAKRPTAQQIAAAQRAAEEAEMRVVLAQPHRRGNRSQLAESPLGRFCLALDLPRELFDAGESYACLRHRWRAAQQAPSQMRLGGTPVDVDLDQIRKWEDLLDAWERAMQDAGGWHGKISAMALAMGEPPEIRIYVALAAKALLGLAKHQGRIR